MALHLSNSSSLEQLALKQLTEDVCMRMYFILKTHSLLTHYDMDNMF